MPPARAACTEALVDGVEVRAPRPAWRFDDNVIADLASHQGALEAESGGKSHRLDISTLSPLAVLAFDVTVERTWTVSPATASRRRLRSRGVAERHAPFQPGIARASRRGFELRGESPPRCGDRSTPRQGAGPFQLGFELLLPALRQAALRLFRPSSPELSGGDKTTAFVAPPLTRLL